MENATPSVVAPPHAGVRLEFLDACRALAVLGMLFANLMNVFLRRVPEVLQHNEGDRLRLFDFPAPIFQFLLGVSLVLFLERRSGAGLGRRGARLSALRRFTLLILLGLVLDGLGALTSRPRWGVLQTLGLGGAIATGLADVPDAGVGAVVVGLLAAFLGPANGEVHRSPLAALAFVPLTLAGLLVGRGLRSGRPGRPFVRRSLALAGAGFAVAAVVYAVGVPFNKVHGSASFIALATAVSSLFLLATAMLARSGTRFPSWLLAVGANALTVWVLQYVLVYYPAWLVFPAWRRLPFVPGMAATLMALATLAGLTVALGRRGIRIPI